MPTKTAELPVQGHRIYLYMSEPDEMAVDLCCRGTKRWQTVTLDGLYSLHSGLLSKLYYIPLDTIQFLG